MKQLHCWWGNIQPLCKTVGQFLIKVNIHLHDSVISLLGICLRIIKTMSTERHIKFLLLLYLYWLRAESNSNIDPQENG